MSFRIIPRQTGIRENGYGFIYEGRMFKWEDYATAMIGAYMLRVHPGEIIKWVFLERDDTGLVFRREYAAYSLH